MQCQRTPSDYGADGYNIGNAPSQPVGFHGCAPVPQRSGAAQAAVTKATGAALAATATTDSSPFGFATQQQGDLITTRINTLIADNAALIVLVNELRAALVAKGLISGAA
jgi:hypothetical protein